MVCGGGAAGDSVADDGRRRGDSHLTFLRVAAGKSVPASCPSGGYGAAGRSLVAVADREGDASVGELADFVDVDGEAAAEERARRGMCVGREGMIRRTREGDRIQEGARAERAFDAVRFLGDGMVADDASDEEARGGNTGVEITLLAIFQEQVLARIAADEHLGALGAAALDGRADGLLFFRRIDQRGLQPAELFLAPCGHVLRAALLEFGGHEAPHADALGAGIFRARVEVGRPSMWPNSWQKTLMLVIVLPPSGQMKYEMRASVLERVR